MGRLTLPAMLFTVLRARCCVCCVTLTVPHAQMSHRKFEAPRHGSLQFLPKKRCANKGGRGKIGAFPRDSSVFQPHLTGFLGFKAGESTWRAYVCPWYGLTWCAWTGMTHVVREVNKIASKVHKKEIVEPVTIIETPPMVAVGIVGYAETPKGLKAVTSVWAAHISQGAKRRFYKNWKESKKKAFAKYASKSTPETREAALERLRKEATVVRIIAHTQFDKVKQLGHKKDYIMEIQVRVCASLA